MKVITDNDTKADLKSKPHCFNINVSFSFLNLTHRITRIFGNLDFESSLVSLWHKIVRPPTPTSAPGSATFWIFFKSLGFFLHTFFYFQNCFWFILKSLNIINSRSEWKLSSSLSLTLLPGGGKFGKLKSGSGSEPPPESRGVVGAVPGDCFMLSRVSPLTPLSPGFPLLFPGVKLPPPTSWRENHNNGVKDYIRVFCTEGIVLGTFFIM